MQIDTNLSRKDNLIEVRNYKGIPLFSIVEFNITDLCNRKCSFCPRVNPKLYKNRNKHISIGLYEKVMVELQNIDYDGVILYSAFGEPLLHNNLYELLKTTKVYCPDSHLEIVTNGDFITDENIEKLFTNGLDTLLFSFYDGKHQLDEFIKLKENHSLTDEQMQYRERYKSEIILSNRAGVFPQIENIKNSLVSECFYPFYQITIDLDGSVLVCPHDWNKNKISNIKRNHLIGIWNGNALTDIRKKLIKKNRNFKPCDKCNVKGILMGNKFFNSWVEYYERNFR